MSASPARPVAFWKRLALLLAAPALGAVLAYVGLSEWVIPATGLGGVERIRQLGRRLETPLDDRPTALFLGDSVTLEGIDASIVEGLAPSGWTVENCSLTGCMLSEQFLLLPKALAARPRAVVFCLTPIALPNVPALEADKAYAYAFGGFVEAWPAGWTKGDLPPFDDAIWAALTSSRRQQLLHFRAAPLTALNGRIRGWARRDIRSHVEREWKAPFEMLSSFDPGRLEWHRQFVIKSIESRPASWLDGSLQLLERLVRMTRDAGALPIVVIGPVHPGMREFVTDVLPPVRQRLERLEREIGVFPIDCCDVLAAEHFADMLHPNAAGREVYSQAVGRAFPPLGELPVRDIAGGKQPPTRIAVEPRETH